MKKIDFNHKSFLNNENQSFQVAQHQSGWDFIFNWMQEKLSKSSVVKDV